MHETKTIVIVGGGVVGATTAYYLTRHPKFDPSLHTITLLEASSIAAGASGKAGGLLGMWAYPECLVPLSYRLHQELAEQHGGADKWGYRRVECGSIGATVTKADLGSREATKDVAQAKNALPHTQGELEEQRLHPPTIGTQPVAANGHADSSVASVAPSPSTPSTETSESPSAENGTETTLASAYKTTNAIFELIEDAEDKEWEKLPKQDAAAATLLQDSLLPADLDWIDPKVVHHYEQMGRDGFSETAQVHPFHFTTAIAELARDAGVDIRLGAKVTNIHNDSSAGRTVEYEDRQHGNAVRTMTGVSDVIVAAGPWTGKLLPKSKVEGLRAHSVVYEADVSPYAVFTDIQLPGDWIPEHRKAMGRKRKHRGNVDPEIYARPFGEVYACGEPDKSIPLPETADLVQTDVAQCDDLAAYIATISPTLALAPIRAKQACYLPQHVRFGTERGPLIGPTSTPGIWIAAGHTCWGIQNGPGTGYLMAEWIFDGEPKAEAVDVLHPGKFKV